MSRNSFQFSARCLSVGSFGGVPLHHLDSSDAGRASPYKVSAVGNESKLKSTATTKATLVSLLLIIVSFAFAAWPAAHDEAADLLRDHRADAAHAAPIQIDNLVKFSKKS